MLKMFCSPLSSRYVQLLISGASEEEIETAKRAFETCMEQYGPSVAQAVINQMEEVHGCLKAGGSWWECLGFVLPKRFPGICSERTNEIIRTVFDDINKVMELSKGLEQAFARAGIKFDEDETFVCTIAVAKKPRYISAVIGSNRQSTFSQFDSQIKFIMHPSVMEPVMKAIERDKIK